MIKIKNHQVYGLEESLIASGYPMETGDPGDMDFSIGEKHGFKRGESLGNVPSGSGHDNFLKGIVVQFDIKYPQYWTPQFQRYHFADIVSSQSKMHRLTKMDVKKCCNGYVDYVVIENLENLIAIYNNWEDGCDVVSFDFADTVYSNFERLTVVYQTSFKWHTKKNIFMKIISNTPMGLEMWMRATTSYLQLKTIYLQRNHHKLEDWHMFCAWCESLEDFVTLCLNGVRKFTNEEGHPKPEYDWRI